MADLFSHLIGRAGWAVAGAALLYVLWPQGDPITFREVIVPAPRIIEREPEIETRWRTRIVYRNVDPVQVATSVEGGESSLSAFCKPVVLGAVGDTLAPPAPAQALLRSFSYDDGLLFRPDRWTVTGVLNDGGLKQWDFRSRGSAQAVVHGDTLTFRASRWWWLEDVGVPVAMFAAGFLLGR